MKSPVFVASLIALTSLFATAQQAALVATPDGVAVQLSLQAGPETVRATTASVSDLVAFQFGTSGVAATWTEWSGGTTVDWQAISLDGARCDAVGTIDRALHLEYATFDPVVGTPAIPARLRATAASGLWIVQWATQGLEAYRAHVEDLGGTIHRYLPSHAQIVEADAAVAGEIAALPFVRSMTAFHPAYKLEPALRDAALDDTLVGSTIRLNVLTMRRGASGQDRVAAIVEALGGRVESQSIETFLMSVTIDGSQLAALAASDDVQWIDRWTPIGADMDMARAFVGATWLENNIGFSGAGVRGEIHDLGTQMNHPELSNPIAHGSVGTHPHGTSVAAQVFGQGVNPLARGLCPQGTAIVTDANAYGSRYAHTMQSIDPNGPYRVVFMTSSVGAAQTTAYSSISQNLDLIAFDSNLVHLQSQSNTGTQASRPEAWAKNVISVGGINHYGTLTDTDDQWTGASIGPAADGRMKPNMAAFYDSIYTATSGSSYTGSFGGTSGATPIVAGSVGLIHEMWHAGAFGNATGASVFASRPKDTLVRALLFASATAWDFEGTTDNLARSRQGWGRPDLEKLYTQRQRVHWVNETDVLTNLQSQSYYLNVVPGVPELKVALVWADPAGTTSASQHRVNDLDVVVTSPTGSIYRGNFGLDLSPWSVAGGTKDSINTEECVNIQSPTAGTWKVEVIAAEVNQDGHVETAAVDVDYSLVVLGADPGTVAAPFEMRLETTGAGVGDGRMGLDRIPAGTVTGYCLLSFATLGTVGSGPTAGLWPDALTVQALFTPAAPGNPLHWTAPVGGAFPASDLVLGPGSITLPAGTQLDGFGVAVGQGGQVLGATPVRRITF